MALNGAANETFTDMQNAMEVEVWDTHNVSFSQSLTFTPSLGDSFFDFL